MSRGFGPSKFGPVDQKHELAVRRRVQEDQQAQQRLAAQRNFNGLVATAVNSVLRTFFPDVPPQGRNVATRLNILLAMATQIHVHTTESDDEFDKLAHRHIADQRELLGQEQAAAAGAMAGGTIVDPSTGQPIAGLRRELHPLDGIPLEALDEQQAHDEDAGADDWVEGGFGIWIDGRPYKFAEGTTPEQKARALTWAKEARALHEEMRKGVAGEEKPPALALAPEAEASPAPIAPGAITDAPGAS